MAFLNAQKETQATAQFRALRNPRFLYVEGRFRAVGLRMFPSSMKLLWTWLKKQNSLTLYSKLTMSCRSNWYTQKLTSFIESWKWDEVERRKFFQNSTTTPDASTSATIQLKL